MTGRKISCSDLPPLLFLSACLTLLSDPWDVCLLCCALYSESVLTNLSWRCCRWNTVWVCVVTDVMFSHQWVHSKKYFLKVCLTLLRVPLYRKGNALHMKTCLGCTDINLFWYAIFRSCLLQGLLLRESSVNLHSQLLKFKSAFKTGFVDKLQIFSQRRLTDVPENAVFCSVLPFFLFCSGPKRYDVQNRTLRHGTEVT